MEKEYLNTENIFSELLRAYATLTEEQLDMKHVLIWNSKTHQIYKLAYGMKYGFSINEDLNFLGMDIIIDNKMENNKFVMFML